jgi:ATP-binding cassette subfamily F protein 3
VQAEKLDVTIGDRTLVRNATVRAMRGDVVALIGPNGAGKTTLLSTLLGARAPGAGEVRIGSSISPAWYRQDLAGVPMDQSMYDVILDMRPLWTRGQIQGHLGAFGFSGDEVLRSTNSLSGGERARVALAMITLQRANLLVLDEPTNHLDVESIESLEDAIEEYEGTVILVSHDRAFLRELATHVWAITNGTLEDFNGPFVEWEGMQSERERAKNADAAAATAVRKTAERAAAQKLSSVSTDGSKARKAARLDVERCESAVAAAESRMRDIEASLADPALYQGSGDGVRRAGELQKQLTEARRVHDAAVDAWAASTERLEQMSK